MFSIGDILIFFGLRRARKAVVKRKWSGVEFPKQEQPRYKKRTFYKGYYIENGYGDIDNWSVRVNGKVMTGKLDLLQKSIDWFCETKKLLPPESFEAKAISFVSNSRRLEVEHNGYRIINDSTKHNGWYTVINGHLVKGTETLIKQKIDDYLTVKPVVEEKQIL
ncbi:DUF3319 domain-containing protein [Photobacterium minamisatsumaniensis]|uniref:DUF3319 domain-containing protein n=1 Tax=Photobacterium minamisatsumaniensis TaxID=2910233 RepID=UPI003D124440